jgi:cephalosporin hydroxylase
VQKNRRLREETGWRPHFELEPACATRFNGGKIDYSHTRVHQFMRDLQSTTIEVSCPDGTRKAFDVYSPDGFRLLSLLWTRAGWQNKFSYEFTWLGIPIIQLPEDLLLMQELIHKVRPDVIIETGTAHGGTAIFYASMLELLGGRGRVISIDVDIRKYNRLAIQSHPMSKHVTLVDGSSIDPATVAHVRREVPADARVLVSLDSNHTRAHVLAELENYAPLVTPDSYVVVFDAIMEAVADAPNGSPDWQTDNPRSAVEDFLKSRSDFEIDPYYNRLGVTYCRDGFLRRKSPARATTGERL